jgi:hypothetical protein
MSINMSYCRFQNTLEALRECVQSTYDSSDPLAELSEPERKAAIKLLRLCRQFADDIGIPETEEGRT